MEPKSPTSLYLPKSHAPRLHEEALVALGVEEVVEEEELARGGVLTEEVSCRGETVDR